MTQVDEDDSLPQEARQASKELYDHFRATNLCIEALETKIVHHARHFAAWLGLIPRQYSTGGKTRLGRITKTGNSEIRKSLVVGAKVMIRYAGQWNSTAGAWFRGVLERRRVRLATVALANKMAAHRLGVDDAQGGLPSEGSCRSRCEGSGVTPQVSMVGGGREPV